VSTCHERSRSLWGSTATKTRRLCVKCNSANNKCPFPAFCLFFVVTLVLFNENTSDWAVLQSYSTAVITVLLRKKLLGVKMAPTGILGESKFRAF